MTDDDPNGRRILHNRIKCLHCDETIESKHGHDFVRCKCGAVAVDGGKNYLRCGFRTDPKADYLELSEYEGEDTNGK